MMVKIEKCDVFLLNFNISLKNKLKFKNLF